MTIQNAQVPNSVVLSLYDPTSGLNYPIATNTHSSSDAFGVVSCPLPISISFPNVQQVGPSQNTTDIWQSSFSSQGDGASTDNGQYGSPFDCTYYREAQLGVNITNINGTGSVIFAWDQLFIGGGSYVQQYALAPISTYSTLVIANIGPACNDANCSLGHFTRVSWVTTGGITFDGSIFVSLKG